MSTLSPSSSSVYVTLASLRIAGFEESRIQSALAVLFPEDEQATTEPDFEIIDPWLTLEPSAPAMTETEDYQPSKADWQEMASWSEAIEQRWDDESIAEEELAEAHARADVMEAIDRARCEDSEPRHFAGAWD